MEKIKDKITDVLLDSNLALIESYGCRSASFEELDWRDAEKIAERIIEEARPDVKNLESMVTKLIEVCKEYKEALMRARDTMDDQDIYHVIDDEITPILNKYEVIEWEIETELIMSK